MKAKNIVVATDFSEPSEAALALATALARDTGATLHITHVKQPMAVYKLSRRYGDVPPCPELDTLKKVLETVVPTDSKVPFRRWLFTGDDIPKEILKLAAEVDADFIVMGTHGRAGISRLLVGSTAEGVVRHASCPVLTIKHPRVQIIEPTAGVLPA